MPRLRVEHIIGITQWCEANRETIESRDWTSEDAAKILSDKLNIRLSNEQVRRCAEPIGITFPKGGRRIASSGRPVSAAQAIQCVGALARDLISLRNDLDAPISTSLRRIAEKAGNGEPIDDDAPSGGESSNGEATLLNEDE